MASSPLPPSMRRRMEARERHAQTLPDIWETSSLASASITKEQHFLHEQHSMSSFATSSVSGEELSTDYGLHRALNSIVVPNDQNPIATLKDRKNANYLEHIHETDRQLRADLEDAFAAYDEAISRRDFEYDPKLEALRNLEYVEANNRLGRCSRDYNVFLANLEELRSMPKTDRGKMQRLFTDIKAQERLDRIDENESSTREKLRQTRQEIAELQFDREQLKKHTASVQALSEHVAYQAHLLTHKTERIEDLYGRNNELSGRNEDLLEQAQYVEHANDTLKREYALACESFGKHFRQVDELNEDLKERMTACVNENETLKRTLEQQSSNCQTLMQYSGQVKDEITELRRDMDGVRINVDSLQHDNSDLERENGELKQELEYSRDFVQKLSDKLHDLQADLNIVNSQLSYAKAVATEKRDEAAELRIAQADLREALEDAHVQMQQFKINNDNLLQDQAHQQDRLDAMRESNAHLRREFNELLRGNTAVDGSAVTGMEYSGGVAAGAGADVARRQGVLKGWRSV